MLLIWGSIAGILTLVGGWLLYNNAAQRKLGSTLVLVFSILSMNFIGLILGLIGGFLGYTYKTGASTTNTSSSSRDRKSTRLNSSHSQISYAVFCLKKKKN